MNLSKCGVGGSTSSFNHSYISSMSATKQNRTDYDLIQGISLTYGYQNKNFDKLTILVSKDDVFLDNMEAQFCLTPDNLITKQNTHK